MDAIAFPVALLILAYVLRSLRLLIIPILNMAASILTSFMIVLPIAEHSTFISFAPSLMMSICIAMSIDYSLFNLSRSVLAILTHQPHSLTRRSCVADTARSCSMADQCMTR